MLLGRFKNHYPINNYSTRIDVLTDFNENNLKKLPFNVLHDL